MSLIVTCPRHFESETKKEIREILEELGDEKPEIFETGLSGILTVKTHVELNQVPEKIREKIQNEPWTIRYILRVIPIQKWIETDLDHIVLESYNLSKIINANENYRITIEKRNSNLSTKEIISKLADKINKKVVLDNPIWVVLIEIIGSKTGLSVLPRGTLLSVEKEKRSISE